MSIVCILEAGVFQKTDLVCPKEATKNDLLLVHTPRYLKSLEVDV